MTEIKIERAKRKDAAYIEEKLGKYILDSSNFDWSQFFVARNSISPVAFGRIVDHGDFLEISSVGVDYYHRKKGIGKKMFLFLVQEAEKLDTDKPLYIVTHIPDFFKNLDFKEVGIYPDYLEDKKINRCKLHASKIKIMKYTKSTP